MHPVIPDEVDCVPAVLVNLGSPVVEGNLGETVPIGLAIATLSCFRGEPPASNKAFSPILLLLLQAQ